MKNLLKTSAILALLALVSFSFSQKNSNLVDDSDKASLLFMLEEEKLAYDVYTHFYQKWETTQFGNIRGSEQTHIEKVQEILDKNEISYTLLDEGKFRNVELQKLYNDLISRGNVSEIEALKAGATIEDVDIFDLKRLKNQTKNEDIISAYNFLECASRNHLRAFNRGLEMRNAEYKPQFISQKDYEEIINGEHEKCGQLLQNGMGKGKNCSANDNARYGQKAETGEAGCAKKCE